MLGTYIGGVTVTGSLVAYGKLDGKFFCKILLLGDMLLRLFLLSCTTIFKLVRTFKSYFRPLINVKIYV